MTQSRGMMKHKVLATVLLTSLLGLALPATAATPRWSSAVTVTPLLNPDPTRGFQQNSVAVNASGLAVATWDQFSYTAGVPSSIGAAVQATTGRWGAPFTISNAAEESYTPRAAVGDDGTAMVVWLSCNAPTAVCKVEVATLLPGSGNWTTPAVLTSFSYTGVFEPNNPLDIKIDGRGNATAIWWGWNGAHDVVQAATRPAGGMWSSPVTLNAAGTDAFDPTLAMNAAGTVVAAWAVSPYAGSYTTELIQAATMPAGGTWSAPVNLSATLPFGVGYYQNPRVAIDGNGLAAAVWIYLGSPANQLFGTRQLSGTSWSTPAALSPANQMYFLSSPSVGMDGKGNVVAAVTIFDATINVDRGFAWAVTRPAGADWSAGVRLTTSGQDATTTRVAVAPDSSVAMIGWVDVVSSNVQVARQSGSGWAAPVTIGTASSLAEFQEFLSLCATRGSSARAVWKTKGGTRHQAATYQ